MTPLDIAKNLLERGFNPLPVPVGEKNPTLKKWQTLTITTANVERYFNGSRLNVGAQMGPKSNGLTDVDLDCPEAVRLAPYFLPTTNSKYGRASKRRSHWLYRCPDPLAKAWVKLTDENKVVILELRLGGGGKGSQSIMPGSVHKSGEHYEWDENGTQTEYACSVLLKAVKKIAAATLLARNWPERGRNEAAMIVGGFLARAGWNADDIGQFVVAVQEVAGIEDQSHVENGRVAAVSAIERLAQGGQVYGLPALKEQFGEAVGKTIAKHLDYKNINQVASLLNWRECKANGSPIPSMHNARIAITALGVECSHDTFHNKLLFGYEGKEKHIVQFMLGEVSDNGIIALRQLLSDRFGFDLGDRHVRDAVISLANENRFDPVCDMLDEAEIEWDGVKRLDRMAVDYFNCEDTPLNRACVRKTMIAAVRRARRPGCKFDNITVLESPEGWNKSSAWRVLAGDDNFSDQSILGVREKEAQELLGPIWIHESADLAGMRKADVDHIKAFASRQEDIARPAYGHFVIKQKRHAINVGTTNNDEYLQSQTGNRRFWPLRILASIDVEKLRTDRLQLWGEAAKCEADGERITISEELWPEASKAQEARRVRDPWESIILEKLSDGFVPELAHKVDDQWRVFTKVLLSTALNIDWAQQEPRHSMRLAAVMKQLGWQRTSNKKITINGVQDYGYFKPCEETT